MTRDQKIAEVVRHGPEYRASIATRKCEAGCGRTVKERRRRFCSNSCSSKSKGLSGRAAGRYNGGLYQNRSNGRWLIVCRDGSGLAFYRAVMEAELHRPLNRNEHVHHINGDPSDDRLENLQVLSSLAHNRLHNAKLTEDQVREVKSLLGEGWEGAAIARAYGVSAPTISAIKHRQIWAEV